MYKLQVDTIWFEAALLERRASNQNERRLNQIRHDLIQSIPEADEKMCPSGIGPALLGRDDETLLQKGCKLWIIFDAFSIIPVHLRQSF